MNLRYFISSIVLFWICCCSMNISYACNHPPNACICSCPKYTAVDYPVYFNGSCSSDVDGYIVDWRWYWPSGAYETSEDWWEAWCKFDATGIYTVTLEVEDNMGATDVFHCTVYVVKVDLDIVGMDEEEEDDPGRYIAVNSDDDNENSTQDKNDDGTVDGEDDLVQITLSITPSSVNGGILRLLSGVSGETIRVWTDQTKGTQLNVIDPTDPEDPTHAIWILSEESFPETLWVEGYQYSSYPCGGLGLNYNYSLDWDGVLFNPVQIDLSMDGVTEDTEEFPGNFIGLNDDDDNDNGWPDHMDDEYDDSSAEDDMLKINIIDAQPNNKLSGTMTFDESSGGSKVTVWKPDYEDPYNKKKFERITLPKTFDTPHEGGQNPWFYVEGISQSISQGDVEFSLSYTVGGETFKDIINLTVVGVALHATDLDGNVVSNQYEEKPGVDLHFNIDNDNDSSNSVPPSPSTKLPGADYYETINPVINEDDVKSLEMSLLPSLDFGHVILSNPSSAWLWKSPTKGSSNFVMAGSESKTWDLSIEEERNDFLGLCSTLYAEGMNIGYGDIVLKYEYPLGNEIHSDKVCYNFRAAYCGDQPKTEEEDIYAWSFKFGIWVPKNAHIQRDWIEELISGNSLKRCQYSITDNLATPPWSGGKRCTKPEYNCIGWSVGPYVWYNEQDIDEDYGDDDGIFEDSDMDEFYFKKMGWSLITSGTDEQKAALASAMYFSYDSPWNYSNGDDKPGPGYHAARRSGCFCGLGAWIMYTSKCGQWEQIEHDWDQLNGGAYGDKPDRFYKLFLDP